MQVVFTKHGSALPRDKPTECLMSSFRFGVSRIDWLDLEAHSPSFQVEPMTH